MLSDQKIWEAVEAGTISIQPFDRDNLGPNSYDLTISENYAVQSRAIHQIYSMAVNDPDEVERVENCWQHVKAATHIGIDPKSFVRCVTNEVVGVKSRRLGLLSPRSKLARFPLMFSYSQLVDTGFRGKISFAIYNPNPFKVFIPVDHRVLQIMFVDVTGSLGQGYDRRPWSQNLDQFGDGVPGYKVDKEWLK